MRMQSLPGDGQAFFCRMPELLKKSGRRNEVGEPASHSLDVTTPVAQGDEDRLSMLLIAKKRRRNK